MRTRSFRQKQRPESVMKKNQDSGWRALDVVRTGKEKGFLFFFNTESLKKDFLCFSFCVA